VRQLLVTANVPTSPIFVTLMMEALHSSEILDLIRATQRNIPEDAILHSHRRENLKSYNIIIIIKINLPGIGETYLQVLIQNFLQSCQSFYA
jgi:hypothetical protein